MRMIKRSMMLGLILACTALLADSAQQAEFAVVVNSSNHYAAKAESMKQVVRQLYLKERSDWPSKLSGKPFGRPADNEAHRAFLKQVLHMSEVELASHWISVKQRTGQAAPREVGRDRLLLKLVGKYEGALAVVSMETAQGSDVRILFTFSD